MLCYAVCPVDAALLLRLRRCYVEAAADERRDEQQLSVVDQLLLPTLVNQRLAGTALSSAAMLDPLALICQAVSSLLSPSLSRLPTTACHPPSSPPLPTSSLIILLRSPHTSAREVAALYSFVMDTVGDGDGGQELVWNAVASREVKGMAVRGVYAAPIARCIAASGSGA